MGGPMKIGGNLPINRLGANSFLFLANIVNLGLRAIVVCNFQIFIGSIIDVALVLIDC